MRFGMMKPQLTKGASIKGYVPSTPAPSAAKSGDGMKVAREQSRRYLPDIVKLLAGIALSPNSEAASHTRMLAAKQLVDIAGAIPQATPSSPLLHDPAVDGGDTAVDGGETE
jgi:hypothetical protein